MGARKGKREGCNFPGGCPKTATTPTIRAAPAGEVYGASNWALKTNERSVAKQMPLLSEFPSYSEWGDQEDGRKPFIITPVSSIIDYFMVNLLASTNRTDSESWGGAWNINLGRK